MPNRDSARRRYNKRSEGGGNNLFSHTRGGLTPVIRGYFDESCKDKRVYAIGGYVGRDKDWTRVSRRWKNRRLEDKIRCFHATDCESGHGEFKRLQKEERVKLKADLIQIVHAQENLGGFAAAIHIEDFIKVRDSSARARQVLGPDPYFLCFQTLLMAVCEEFERGEAGPGMKFACILENQEEFSGRARRLYTKFKAINKNYATRLGRLTYAAKNEFVALEIADNLAYETMKEVLNKKYDPTRARRIAMEKMLPRVRNIKLLTEEALTTIASKARISSDFSLSRPLRGPNREAT